MHILDTFSDEQNVELSVHAMNEGDGWIKLGSDAQIIDNAMAGIPGNPNPLYLTDAYSPTGTMLITPNVDLGDDQIAMHIAKDEQSRFGYLVICYPAAGLIEIYTVGTANVRSLQRAYAFAPGKQQWKVEVTDNNLSFFIGTELVAFLSGIAPTNHWWGIEMFKSGDYPLSTISRFRINT